MSGIPRKTIRILRGLGFFSILLVLAIYWSDPIPGGLIFLAWRVSFSRHFRRHRPRDEAHEPSERFRRVRTTASEI
jgi:hypothetical protein